MKYDCELIQDIVPLYKDGVLSEKSRQIVDEHLDECQVCKSFYQEFSEEKTVEPDAETEKIKGAAAKISRYRRWQCGAFGMAVVLMFSLFLNWFGVAGVSGVSGWEAMNKSLLLPGLVMWLLAIWYPFQSEKRRITVGCVGLALILFEELWCGLCWGSVAGGMVFAPFGIEILSFTWPAWEVMGLDMLIESADFGYYFGAVVTVANVIVLILKNRLIMKGKYDTIKG